MNNNKEEAMTDFNSPTMLRAIDEMDKRNYSVALALLVPLAEMGNQRARCNLAILYSFGWGVTMNAKKAVELYHGVAEQNIQEGHLSAIAYNNLATIYFTGVSGVERDIEKGQECLARARELGFEM
jgi:TPR repeat protein